MQLRGRSRWRSSRNAFRRAMRAPTAFLERLEAVSSKPVRSGLPPASAVTAIRTLRCGISGDGTIASRRPISLSCAGASLRRIEELPPLRDQRSRLRRTHRPPIRPLRRDSAARVLCYHEETLPTRGRRRVRPGPAASHSMSRSIRHQRRRSFRNYCAPNRTSRSAAPPTQRTRQLEKPVIFGCVCLRRR